MKTMIILSLFVMQSAFADYALSKNGKKVVCYGADNQVLTLNAGRTSVKYSVEGESLGAKKIERVTKGAKSVSYWTEDLTLTLSDKGDTFQYDGGDVESVECN